MRRWLQALLHLGQLSAWTETVVGKFSDHTDSLNLHANGLNAHSSRLDAHARRLARLEAMLLSEDDRRSAALEEIGRP